MTGKRIDQPTGTETVGHEWDGIEELDTPLPRWWLWTFYLTIAWSLVYVLLYPAVPLLRQGTEGLLGWTSRGQLAQEVKASEQGRTAIREQLARIPIERLPEDSALMSHAVAGGAAAFKVNCVQCHGSAAAGIEGLYPNLNDDDWLWGGDLKAIHTTIEYGIRQPGEDRTRASMMPAFGRDGLLTSAEISSVADHVLSLSGKGKASPAGAALYENNCASCHGPDGRGMREFGSPNLADAIWLYGGSKEAVERQIANPRQGVMPSWANRLDPVTIKMLAAFVHSRGGGEDFVEVAAKPPAAADAKP